MKIVDEVEIEISGEEGARLFAAAGPALDGLRLRLVRDGVSASVEIDFEEARSLRRYLDAHVPRTRHTPSDSLEFEALDAALVFHPDNMGEPFRAGLTASFRSSRLGCTWVFMENRQAETLKRFVDTHAPAPAPVPGR